MKTKGYFFQLDDNKALITKLEAVVEAKSKSCRDCPIKDDIIGNTLTAQNLREAAKKPEYFLVVRPLSGGGVVRAWPLF